MIVLDRLVNVGEGLRLHPLRGVHHQQRAFACGEAAADFIGEVDVAGGVHQVELIGLAVLGRVVEADGLGFDGDAALFFNVHVIKDLLGHLAIGEPAGELDQPVSQRGLAMVDVSDNAEIADLGKVSHLRRI